MEKERLLAFTDGVIIITIMVLEMKVPQDASLGSSLIGVTEPSDPTSWLV